MPGKKGSCRYRQVFEASSQAIFARRTRTKQGSKVCPQMSHLLGCCELYPALPFRGRPIDMALIEQWHGVGVVSSLCDSLTDGDARMDIYISE